MSDSNPTRVRHAQFKAAFDEVIGDPFAPEPIEGGYVRLKRKTPVKIMQLDDLSSGSKNPARPLVNDFFIDVENAIRDVITDPEILQQFWETYLWEEPVLNQDQRNAIEQMLGKKFIARRLVPVDRYFITIRQKRG